MRSPSPTDTNLAPLPATFIGETTPSWPTAPPHHHGGAAHPYPAAISAAHGRPSASSVPTGYSLPSAHDFPVYFSSSPEFIASSSHRSAPPLRHSAPHTMSPYPSYTITPSAPASLRAAPHSGPPQYLSMSSHSPGMSHLQAELARMTPFTTTVPPLRSAAFGSPAYYTPNGPPSIPPYHQPAHSSGPIPSFVDGFPHPFHQGYSGTDRSCERSQKRYYVVYRGRHRGIFHSWPLAWALTAGYRWGTLRGQVGGFTTFSDAASAYLHHAGDVDPYAPIPGCGPLSVSIPLGALDVDPISFYARLFHQPHIPFPQRPLPIPADASPLGSVEHASFHSPRSSPQPDTSSPPPPLPLQSVADDSFTIVSSHLPDSLASSIATKADVQAALVTSLAFADAKKELSIHLPRFNGDPTKFNEWFTMITTRLSTPVWRHIHLASPSDPSYTALSQSLYSVLIVALHDQASDHWRSREDILHNGIALLHEVIQYYRVSHSYSLINLLTAWDTLFQKDKETPLQLSFRTRELVSQAAVAGQHFTEPFICYRFLLALGLAFHSFVQPYLLHQKDITTMTLVTLVASAKTYTDMPGFDTTKMGHPGRPAASPSSTLSPTAWLGNTSFSHAQARSMLSFKCPVHRCNGHEFAQCSLVTPRFSIIPKPTPSVSATAPPSRPGISPSTGVLGSGRLVRDILPPLVPSSPAPSSYAAAVAPTSPRPPPQPVEPIQWFFLPNQPTLSPLLLTPMIATVPMNNSPTWTRRLTHLLPPLALPVGLASHPWLPVWALFAMSSLRRTKSVRTPGPQWTCFPIAVASRIIHPSTSVLSASPIIIKLRSWAKALSPSNLVPPTLCD